eukprot:m.134799 g.134799  ORF g.134799 m.134799 type:complete len:201 (-) comp14700_c0_seq20:1452-2054(-)
MIMDGFFKSQDNKHEGTKKLSLKLKRGPLSESQEKSVQKRNIDSILKNGPAKRIAPVSGLTNIGNTCYMNSVVQALRRCHGFCAGLKDCKNQKVAKELKTAYESMSREEKAMTESSGTPCVSPDALLDVVQQRNSMFEGTRQHDAQEFLRFLLSDLQEDSYFEQRPLQHEKVISKSFLVIFRYSKRFHRMIALLFQSDAK